MQDNPQQKVLPFLADDPLYLRQVREERIVLEVKESLEPVLREKMVQIISDMAEAGFKVSMGASKPATNGRVRTDRFTSFSYWLSPQCRSVARGRCD